MTRPAIDLTRLDGKSVTVFTDAISIIGPPLDGEGIGRSKLLISGAYDWFQETPEQIFAKLNHADRIQFPQEGV